MNTQLIIYPELESTQDTARELALAGRPEGTAVLAMKQTRGRGRSGHSWVSPPGKNVALSVILRPLTPPSEAALLGLMAAVAVAETVEELGTDHARLKWPNDVMVHHRKIAGILPEARMTAQSVDFVIMGVGLNVNAQEEDFPVDLRESATSVFRETDKTTDLEQAAQLLLQKLNALYARTTEEGCSFIPGLWQTRWAQKGARIAIQDRVATAVGIAEDGALIVETADAGTMRVTSGEVLSVPPFP
ncbi:MAG TPA: biotin--[acetyl-CoA-carboxylase] ligase [Desulfomonilaceae bacterium]|nr:biotin--[acetyl-CoA-carboxylase] ligase [Desulfomonilaceae bacterium]